MKKYFKSSIRKVLTALVLVLVLAGCSQKESALSENQEAPIRVGSKDFTEGLILSELYSLALEEAGYTVERVFNLGSPIIHSALVNDEIDLYPEYTGTGLLSVLKLPLESDPDLVYETVKSEYQKRFDLVWLDYSRVNNSQGLVIATKKAEELGIKTISDLQANAPALIFASQGEFDVREDGLPGLEKAYGKFAWKSSAIYDNSLKYQVLSSGEADVAPAYTTEGQLSLEEFTLLEDDKSFWPPYNAAPVLHADLLKEHPDLADILNGLSAQLDSDDLMALNAEVDIEHEEYETAAGNFFQSLAK